MHPASAQPALHGERAVPGLAARLALLAVNGLAFQLAYSLCNAAAQRASVTRHVAMAWDADLPFVTWMILPYLTSVPLLVLGFMGAPDGLALRAYSQRLLLATAGGCLVFALWPLAFHGPRPQPADPLWGPLYERLHRLDGPYNQWPSLHVAYMVVLWPTVMAAVRSTLLRGLIVGWLLLVVVSTVFTHQHHVADLGGGLLLGALAWRAVPVQRQQPAVALHYGVAAVLALVVSLTVQPGWLRGLCVWLAACAAAVAWAYGRRRPDFLHKRDGRFPLWVWLLYGPYLAGYVLTWWAVRWRERHQPPVQSLAPGLWVGRRLSAREAATWLPPGCSVIDLANELGETPSLRPGPGRRYQAEALLDLLPVPPASRQRVLQRLQQELALGHPVFLHCAMGYSRSRSLALAHLQHHPQSPSPRAAVPVDSPMPTP
jgi:hypothetical protein